jgi:hypothetical protein
MREDEFGVGATRQRAALDDWYSQQGDFRLTPAFGVGPNTELAFVNKFES